LRAISIKFGTVTQIDPLDRSDRYNFQIFKIQDSGGCDLGKCEKSRYLDRSSSDFYEIWHTDVLITTCPGIDIALQGGFD